MFEESIWRAQVTPSGKGATWMSARMSPACHFFKFDGREQILMIGGRVYDHQRLSPTPTALVIEIRPGPPVQSYEEVYEADCMAHLVTRTEEAGHEVRLDSTGGRFLVTCTSAEVAFVNCLETLWLPQDPSAEFRWQSFAPMRAKAMVSAVLVVGIDIVWHKNVEKCVFSSRNGNRASSSCRDDEANF